MRLPGARFAARQTVISLVVAGLVVIAACWVAASQQCVTVAPPRAPLGHSSAPPADVLPMILGVALLIGGALGSIGLARRADGECRYLLTARAEAGGMTVLRCRQWWVSAPIEAGRRLRVVYRLTAIDRQGRLRSAWAFVTVMFFEGELVACGVEFRWSRGRTIPRPAAPTPQSSPNPLWDRWADG